MRASSDGRSVHDRLSPATASSERPGAIRSLPLRFLERSVRVWGESVLAFFKRWPWRGSFRCRGPESVFAAPDVILRRRRRSSAVRCAIERPRAAHSRSKSNAAVLRRCAPQNDMCGQPGLLLLLFIHCRASGPGVREPRLPPSLRRQLRGRTPR
jgi:hypothetical protein